MSSHTIEELPPELMGRVKVGLGMDRQRIPVLGFFTEIVEGKGVRYNVRLLVKAGCTRKAVFADEEMKPLNKANTGEERFFLVYTHCLRTGCWVQDGKTPGELEEEREQDRRIGRIAMGVDDPRPPKEPTWTIKNPRYRIGISIPTTEFEKLEDELRRARKRERDDLFFLRDGWREWRADHARGWKAEARMKPEGVFAGPSPLRHTYGEWRAAQDRKRKGSK